MRGMIFTLDIILGLSLLIMLLVSGYYLFEPAPLYKEYSFGQKKTISSDFLSSMAEIKVYECSESPTLNVLKNGILTDDEKELSVLDFLLTYWVLSEQESNQTKKDIVENITNELVGSTQLFGGYNFSLVLGNYSVAGNYSSANASVVVSSLVENSYGSGTKYGYMARSYLSGVNTNRSRYVYFGGFVGQGKISTNLELPDYDSIAGAKLSVFSGSNLSLYINGALSGNFSVNISAPNLSANIISTNINLSNFVKGNNTVEIEFSSGDVLKNYLGGGFLKVDYISTAFYEEAGLGGAYFLPGIEGLINVYDGVYASGNLTEAYLHYYNEATGVEIYLNLANATLYSSNDTGEKEITLNETEILNSMTAAGLNFSDLLNTTVPVRVGTRTIDYMPGQGYGDAVLITDISGSMDDCDVDANCTSSLCDNTAPCHNRKINVAKEADKNFVSSMLNVSGNRVGLTSFSTSLGTYHTISDNNISLQAQIDSYTPNGYTCICCGINKSIELLNQTYFPSFFISSGAQWKYNVSFPSTEPPAMSGKNWTHKDYNDTSWGAGNAVLGFFNKSWGYRKQLNISNTAGNLSNYPVRVSINLSSDYSAGRVRQYCEDVRFTYYNATSGNETEAPYFIETCNLSQTSNSTFWAKLPFIENNSITRIYIYYGNNRSLSVNNISVCPFKIIDGRCTKFFSGFEDSASVGKGFNTSVWFVEYGGNNNDARTESDLGGYRSGSFGAEMRNGSNGEVAISTQQGVLDLSDSKSYKLTFWINLTVNNWDTSGYTDRIYIDVFDGSWRYSVMNITGANYDTGSWYNFTLNLSSYNLSSNARIRFDQEANSYSEESHWDDIRIYYGVSSEPVLSSVGVQESASRILGTNITTDMGNNGGSYFLRKKFYVSRLDRILNSTLYVLSDDSAEIYLNGNILDDDTFEHNASYWNRQVSVDKSLFIEGWNILAAKLKNNDDESALFDLALEANLVRRRAMLVMSDGEANYECTPNQYNEATAISDAIQYACNARDQNITVYSVAFGASAGELTLRKIACWNCSANDWLPGENATNCSRYYQSNQEDELKNIYREIAEDIVNFSIQRQAVYVTAESAYFTDILYNDSYIKINKDGEISFGEGEFMLTFEKACTSGICLINKSSQTMIIDARITSYSGDYWTDLVKLLNSSGTNATVYNLSRYGYFQSLGDPYSISVPAYYFSNGQNNLSLFVGPERNNASNVSSAEKVIYSIKVPGYVDYGGESYVFNTSAEARQNATDRLIQQLQNLTGEGISSYTINTVVSMKGIRKLSDVALIKFIVE